MDNLMDIFNQKYIVQSYAECRDGESAFLLSAFRHQIYSIIGKVNDEMELYRNINTDLYDTGKELLMILMEVSKLLPIDINESEKRPRCISDKLNWAISRTEKLLTSNSSCIPNKKAV